MGPVLAMDVVVLSAIIAIPTAIIATIVVLFGWFKIEPAHIARFFGAMFTSIKNLLTARRSERLENERSLVLSIMALAERMSDVEQSITKFKEIESRQRDIEGVLKDLHQTIRDLRDDIQSLDVVGGKHDILIADLDERVEVLAQHIATLAMAVSHNLNSDYFLRGQGKKLLEQVVGMAVELSLKRESPPTDTPRR